MSALPFLIWFLVYMGPYRPPLVVRSSVLLFPFGFELSTQSCVIVKRGCEVVYMCYYPYTHRFRPVFPKQTFFLAKCETGWVGTRNPDARPAHNHNTGLKLQWIKMGRRGNRILPWKRKISLDFGA